MIITIKRNGRIFGESLEINEPVYLAEIRDRLQEKLPYDVMAVNVDNIEKGFDFIVKEDCTVDFLDVQSPAGNAVYQRTLCLIYLAAVKKVMPAAKVTINNALNQGLYTVIKSGDEIDESQVAEIEAAMKDLVFFDKPIYTEIASRDKAMEYLEASGMKVKVEILKQNPETDKVKMQSLDGYKDYFYGRMTPSTGLIKRFKLMKYKKGVLMRFPQPDSPLEIPEFKDEFRLYQAFGEQTLWNKILGVSFMPDLNKKIEDGSYRELMMLSEALHEKKIAEIADMIKTQKKRIILIAGPSSSGKTTFAQRLCIQLKVNGLKPLYMGTDDYFVERDQTPKDENGEYDFENLDAVDIELFNSNMNDLLAGKEVDLPSFDFMEGKKIFGKRILSITDDQPIVIEGIHGLNEALTAQIPKEAKFKIYISPLTQLNIDLHNRISTTDERMLRRMVRDHLYRGRTAQATINGWPKVRKGENKNIFPYSSEADVFFNSYHVYEIGVLKKYAQPLLEAITPDEPEYPEAQRVLELIKYFRPIEDDSMIVNNSIIREFIGGSVFVD